MSLLSYHKKAWLAPYGMTSTVKYNLKRQQSSIVGVIQKEGFVGMVPFDMTKQRS